MKKSKKSFRNSFYKYKELLFFSGSSLFTILKSLPGLLMDFKKKKKGQASEGLQERREGKREGGRKAGWPTRRMPDFSQSGITEYCMRGVIEWL